MKDLKTALQDLAKAKGFNTDGLSEKELFQIVTGIQQPSDEMISGEFASWYVPGGAAVEQEESETESPDETTDEPGVKLTDKITDDPDAELTDKTTDEPDADTTPAKDVDSSDEPTDTTDETKNQSNSTVDVEGDEN